MRSITLSQLRTPKLWLPWLKAGEAVLLYDRKILIARFVPREILHRAEHRLNTAGQGKALKLIVNLTYCGVIIPPSACRRGSTIPR